jgi:hypothetical protein
VNSIKPSGRKFAIWSFGIALIATLIAAIPSWVSKVSVEIDRESLQHFSALPDSDPKWLLFPKWFTLTNEGSLTLRDVQVSCVVDCAKWANGATLKDAWLDKFKQISDRLEAGANVTVQCSPVGEFIGSPYPLTSLCLSIVVQYRSEWSIVRTTRTRRFFCGGPYPYTCVAQPLFPY